eukprot:m.153327 g.153327  ORF g.153327 m.153327 type:complete len:84 (-) comp52856_c1_seq5:1065-1316(-)
MFEAGDIVVFGWASFLQSESFEFLQLDVTNLAIRVSTHARRSQLPQSAPAESSESQPQDQSLVGSLSFALPCVLKPTAVELRT